LAHIVNWKVVYQMKKLFDFVNQNVEITDSILDVGCGDKQYSKHLPNATTLDAWPNVQPNYTIDLNDELFPFDDREFDVVLMIDFIEHLSKRRGELVLEDAKRICGGKIILVTPLIWDNNTKNTDKPGYWCYGNKFNYHSSVWAARDFPDWKRIRKVMGNMYYMGVWTNG